jgi:GDP/UDP-N,N'-diacetylbacillosamine 2-epimerase (hydrolysing)
MKRTICVITGTRADYGLLKPLIDEIRSDATLIFRLIVTGSHLSPEFGSTCTDIEHDGVPVAERIEMLLSSDTPVSVCKSMGLAVIGFSETYSRMKPDIVVVLGDRYEILCAVEAALMHRIPLAHISGGETTEGTLDDSMRHAITKMSHLHFTSTEVYRKRVIQMGESPEMVFNVGALGIDNIRKMRLLTREELTKELGITFNRYNLLVTFHPVTLDENSGIKHFIILLDELRKLTNTNIIFTKANADTGGRAINDLIDGFVAKQPAASFVFSSMGQQRYLSTMSQIDAVVGNSSSGIVEAPALKVGTINIGDRQKGRVKAASVIDCLPEKNSIQEAIQQVTSQSFKEQLKCIENPYGRGDAAAKIMKVLGRYELKGLVNKKYHDIEFKAR